MIPEIKEKISFEVIKTLVKRFELFPENSSNNRNAPFHEAFLKAFTHKLDSKVSNLAFFISLSSWLHGLNTTLGQSFFEHVAHIISGGEKREYTSKKLGNLQIKITQKEKINQIVTDLSNNIKTPNVKEENDSLFFNNEQDESVNAIDFSADVFFEDDKRIVAIELKTVKPNSGEMRGEKHKILERKTALSNKFSEKEILFYIGFPFDPTSNSPTGYNKQRFLKSIINMEKYFDPKETLIASKLWDYLSGEENTMENILSIINAISTTDFLEKYKFLNNTNNKSKLNIRYINILKEWNLFSELKLIENNDKIKSKINNQMLRRIYNQKIFNGTGKYNFDRFNKLNELLSY